MSGITVNSPIVGPPSGSLADALDYAGTDNADYVRELYRLCALVGIDPAILFAQSAHETADWTSYWWETRHNPAGIGITGDPAQNAASQVWANGTDAARGHFVHMLAYANVVGIEASRAITTYGQYDKRLEKIPTRSFNTVRTIADLTGKWATDPQYAEKIVAKHRAIFGITDDAIPPERNNVSTPVIYNLATEYARFGLTQAEAYSVLDNRFDDRRDSTGTQGEPEYIVFHIQDGYTKGSLESWVGRDASSTVMIQRDGSILRVIPEQHGPWTNGDDYAPTPAGQPLVDMPGNSNIWTLSIEAEGTPADPPTNYPAQMAAIEWQARQWMGRFPKTAIRGHQLRHADVNQQNKPNCPGEYYPVIMARIEDAIEDGSTAIVPDPIWWTPGVDVGPVKRASDGAVALAMFGEVTADRTVPIYRNAAMAKGDIVETWTHGTKGKIGGTYVRPNGLGKKPTRVAFVQTSDGGWGRARLSAFSPDWPTL